MRHCEILSYFSMRFGALAVLPDLIVCRPVSSRSTHRSFGWALRSSEHAQGPIMPTLKHTTIIHSVLLWPEAAVNQALVGGDGCASTVEPVCLFLGLSRYKEQMLGLVNSCWNVIIMSLCILKRLPNIQRECFYMMPALLPAVELCRLNRFTLIPGQDSQTCFTSAGV